MHDLVLSAKNNGARQSGNARYPGYPALCKRVGFHCGKQAQGPLINDRHSPFRRSALSLYSFPSRIVQGRVKLVEHQTSLPLPLAQSAIKFLQLLKDFRIP